MRADETPVYNTEKSNWDAKTRAPMGHQMPTFEDFGRKLDREIERLREVAQKKISPAARLKAAHSLRRMSEKLAQMAADIEAKVEPKADSR